MRHVVSCVVCAEMERGGEDGGGGRRRSGGGRWGAEADQGAGRSQEAVGDTGAVHSFTSMDICLLILFALLMMIMQIASEIFSVRYCSAVGLFGGFCLLCSRVNALRVWNFEPCTMELYKSLVICQFWNAELLFTYDSEMLCLKIREQKIKTLTPREAGYTYKLTDKALLDVRPSNERQKVDLSTNNFWLYRTLISGVYCLVFVLVYSKTGALQAWVKGSTWIPIFDMDTSVDLGGLSKKVSNFVMGMPLTICIKIVSWLLFIVLSPCIQTFQVAIFFYRLLTEDLKTSFN